MLETARTLARGNPWAFQIWYEGLTPEERLGLDISKIIDAFQQAFKTLLDTWEQIREAVIVAAQALMELIQMIYPIWRQLILYCKLRRWYLPHWLSLRLARYWPRRWLLP